MKRAAYKISQSSKLLGLCCFGYAQLASFILELTVLYVDLYHNNGSIIALMSPHCKVNIQF